MTKKATIAGLVLIFLITAFSITLFFQPIDIFSNSPIYTDDYSMHLSHCLTTKRFLLSSGKCWGYDPFFLAGFPHGALVNADNKAWELLFFILSPLLGEGCAFKLYLILLLLSYPLLIYLSARNFSLSREHGLLAALMALLLFHLSLAVDFMSWGMVSFVWVSFLSLYLLSLFYTLFHHFTWKRYLLTTLLSSLVLLMHILSPLLLVPPLLILYVCHFKTLTPRHHLSLALMALIVLSLNSYWLIPVTQFFQDKTTRPENYRFTLQIENVLEPLNVYIRQTQSILHRKTPALNNTFMDALLLLFGLAGFFGWWKEGKQKLSLSLLGGILFLFAAAYYGSHTSVFPQLQPQRFTLPLNVFLLLPASAGMGALLLALFRGKGALETVFILSLITVLLVQPVFKPLKTLGTYNLYRLSCEFPAPLTELLNWLEHATTREGRILIEDSECDTAHQYFGAHFPALFPEYLKREYLCGPRPLYPIKHSYASFTAGVLFEKKIEDYALPALQSCFDLYNVKWIVCWSEESKNVFDQYPGYMLKLKEIDKFTIYQVNRKPSFFIKGEGLVKSDYNRIELSQVIPQDSEVIISYHWMKYFKTNPPRKLERVFVGDDPVGFIRIIDPPESIVVYNGY